MVNAGAEHGSPEGQVTVLAGSGSRVSEDLSLSLLPQP